MKIEGKFLLFGILILGLTGLGIDSAAASHLEPRQDHYTDRNLAGSQYSDSSELCSYYAYCNQRYAAADNSLADIQNRQNQRAIPSQQNQRSSAQQGQLPGQSPQGYNGLVFIRPAGSQQGWNLWSLQLRPFEGSTQNTRNNDGLFQN